MSKRRQRRPRVIEALGKLQSASQFTDDNLSDLQDLAMIVFLQAQHELLKRGISSDVVVQRTRQIKALCAASELDAIA